MCQDNLKVQERKESKDNYQAVQSDENERLQFYLYTLADNNLKRNLKKFPFNNVNITRLLRPWDFPGKNTGVGCHCLLRVAV